MLESASFAILWVWVWSHLQFCQQLDSKADGHKPAGHNRKGARYPGEEMFGSYSFKDKYVAFSFQQ